MLNAMLSDFQKIILSEYKTIPSKSSPKDIERAIARNKLAYRQLCKRNLELRKMLRKLEEMNSETLEKLIRNAISYYFKVEGWCDVNYTDNQWGLSSIWRKDEDTYFALIDIEIEGFTHFDNYLVFRIYKWGTEEGEMEIFGQDFSDIPKECKCVWESSVEEEEIKL